MDPLSATAGVLQVITQCAQCTVTLAKWIGQMKTVNERLQSFSQEVMALKLTQENLKQSLEMPSMVEAARATNDSSGHLWTQIFVTLEDCKATLVSINQTLDKINRPTKFGRPLKVLLESLNTGDLSRYYQRIQLFNVSLQLPMQMITITLQLSQRDITESSHKQLISEILLVKERTKTTSDRLKSLKRVYASPVRRPSFAQSSTLMDSSQIDGTVYENLDKCMDKVKGFISSASTVASTKSSTTSTILDDEVPTLPNLWRGSEHGVILTQRDRLRIDSWVPVPNQPNRLPTPAESEYDQSQVLGQQLDQLEIQGDTEEDVELELARTYVENGQTEMEQQSYAAAEENFREAIDLLKDHDFGESLAFEPADVTLMLAECCFKQKKCDEAIRLLLPLSETQSTSILNKASDVGQMLAVDHMLGQVYLQKQEYDSAEKYGLRAFTGRRRHLRENHQKSLESVQLVVDIYRAMGKQAKANAYSKFLTPRQPRAMSQSEEHTLPLFPRPSIVQAETATSPRLGPPTSPSTGATGNRASPDLHQTPTRTTRSDSTTPHPFDNDSSYSTSITRSSTRLSASQSVSRQSLEPKFLAVKALAADSKDRAVTMAINLLKTYDPEPSRILIHRTDEIKKNIKKRGLDMGLAATGHGYAPIHFFCELPVEAVAEVEFLIEQGVNLGAVRFKAGFSTDPMTPLQLAIEKGHERIASVIIEAFNSASSIGRSVPDVNTMLDKEGFPPLLAACRRGQVEVVARLLEYGARPNGFPTNWYGNSLLHDASSRCDSKMVKLLLDYQDQTGSMSHRATDIGSIGQQDKFGITPLMYAVMSNNINSWQKEAKLGGRQECVQLLLEHGSKRRSFQQDLQLRDQKGRDVFAYIELEKDGAALRSQFSNVSHFRAAIKEMG